MIYFQKINLQHLPQEQIEKKIRAFSSKRHSSLDLQSSSTYINDEKKFLGLENENYLKIVRIRTPFERYLPRIIVRFDKNDFSFYSIRLCLVSFIITFILTFGMILNIVYSIINKQWESDFLSVLILSLFYLFLISIEIKLTKRRINLIIKN